MCKSVARSHLRSYTPKIKILCSHFEAFFILIFFKMGKNDNMLAFV